MEFKVIILKYTEGHMSNIISEHQLSQIHKNEILGFVYVNVNAQIMKLNLKVKKSEQPTEEVTLILCGNIAFVNSVDDKYLNQDKSQPIIFFEHFNETVTFDCTEDMINKLLDDSTIHEMILPMNGKTPIFSKFWEKQKVEEYIQMFDEKLKNAPLKTTDFSTNSFKI